MTIPVGSDISNEVYTVNQVLTFTSGEGRAVISGKNKDTKAEDLAVIPAGIGC
jgi:mannose-6-phosphate isomerase-like protein (cupin superfamily)